MYDLNSFFYYQGFPDTKRIVFFNLLVIYARSLCRPGIIGRLWGAEKSPIRFLLSSGTSIIEGIVCSVTDFERFLISLSWSRVFTIFDFGGELRDRHRLNMKLSLDLALSNKYGCNKPCTSWCSISCFWTFSFENTPINFDYRFFDNILDSSKDIVFFVIVIVWCDRTQIIEGQIVIFFFFVWNSFL